LYREVKEYFEDERLPNKIKKGGGYHQTGERARSQCELREYYQTNDMGWYADRKNWSGLSSMGMVKTTILKDDGTQSEKKRYYISSLKPRVEEFARAVREHWNVESMHWHLDVTFREDRNHTLQKNAAENMNITRKWALTMLKMLDLGKKPGLRKKRFVLSIAFNRFADAVMGL
jgi:predicted transposase YbfD/YdcC